MTISFFVKDFGTIGNALRDYVLFGLFSFAAYVFPVILILCSVLMMSSKRIEKPRVKMICLAVLFVLVCALFHILLSNAENVKIVNPIFHYKNAVDSEHRIGGGFIGGFVGGLLAFCFSQVGAAIIDIAAITVLVLVIMGLTPKDVWEAICAAVARGRQKRRDRKEQEELDSEYIPESEFESMTQGGRGYDGYEEYDEDDEYYGEVFDRGSRSKKKKAAVTKQAPSEYVRSEPVGAPAAYEGTRRRRKDFDPTSTDDDFPTPDVQLEIPDESTLPEPEKPEVPEVPETSDFDEVEDFHGRESLEVKTLTPDYDGTSDDRFDVFDDESLFENPEDDEIVRRLSKYYLDGEEETLDVTETVVSEVAPRQKTADKKPEAAYEEPKYVFPGIELLAEDKRKKNVDYTQELRDKEAKLIETLDRFNVHTESAGLPARGPSITRYELRPAPGTKVRSIINLVDDIALNLAASGVRIEAPIPGKSAVGIELPNDVRDTVSLRTLIDNDTFRNASGKLTVALGEDVAGAPVYFDIANMPHLLIAGATGMGKSVSINCLLVSLLYKSTPDEVKLILIDPKMVEFSMYSDIPHLLVPVVSDPKKAAGALSWAVSEMERRYGLLNAAAVRNISGYNEVAQNDPTMEKLPQIVIVIDELADLMMTAPDSVNDSIGRIAQKARAAGMHLVLGTQRPSVDVITGTIKNNIPSRIACTVASQIDSRTILDVAGAEQLIGRGDMLFKPVYAPKPIRVQGAYVDEREVESIVEFIKEKNAESDAGYSDDVMTQIESAAEKCMTGKKRSAGGAAAEDMSPVSSSDDEDPMFWKAVELAVDSGKISTSLIQRKCSLGFGRAAKLIDRMEELGFVSAPDGQKPRQVKITKAQLDEIMAASSGEGTSDEDDEAPF